MATLLKLLYASYSSWLGNILGAGLFGTWLAIDFNDIKLIVLGIMAMVWAVGHGLISLWRQYIKGCKEKLELKELEERVNHKGETQVPKIPTKIKSQSK